MERKNPKQCVHLPQEIIEQILSRLPVKPLLKFRRVSKPWRTLIYSKQFINLHLRNSTKNKVSPQHQIIINYSHELMQKSQESTEPSPFDDPIISMLKSPHITGCCNGLVCIYESSERYFLLWNPSTRIFKKLPQVHHEINDSWFVFYRGFFWDEADDDYKVFAVVCVSGQLIFKVYSLKSNSWRRRECTNFEYGTKWRYLKESNFIYSNSMFEVKGFPQEYICIESLVSPQVE